MKSPDVRNDSFLTTDNNKSFVYCTEGLHNFNLFFFGLLFIFKNFLCCSIFLFAGVNTPLPQVADTYICKMPRRHYAVGTEQTRDQLSMNEIDAYVPTYPSWLHRRGRWGHMHHGSTGGVGRDICTLALKNENVKQVYT